MTGSASVWIVALALAALAPFLVRAIGDALEERVRKRTVVLLDRVRARVPPASSAASVKSEPAPDPGLNERDGALR